MKLCKNCAHYRSNVYIDECRFPGNEVKIEPVHGWKVYPSCLSERDPYLGNCGPEGSHYEPRKEKGFFEGLFGA